MDSPTHDVPLTVKEAAAFFGVARSTVWSWISRAKLEPIGYRKGQGQALVYRFGDLAAAEKRFRSSGMGRSRSGHRSCP